MATGMCYVDGFRAVLEVIGDRPVFFEELHGRIWAAIEECYRDTPETRPDYCDLVHRLEGVDMPNAYLHELAGTISLPVNAAHHARELLRLWKLRHGRDRAGMLARYCDQQDAEGMEACLHDMQEEITTTAVEPAKTIAISAADLLANPPPPDKVLVDGLLCRGGVWCVSASSKAGKSALILQTALTMAAAGNLFGAYACTQGKTLIIDLESTPGLQYKRLRAAIDHGRRHGWLPENNDFLEHVRFATLGNMGEVVTVDMIRELARRELRRHGPVDVLAVDPIYLVDAAGDRDENAAGDTTQLLSGLKAAADSLQASLLYTHHHAKGNQAQRDFWDRAAGSGVHARMSFCMSSLTPTEDGGTLFESLTRGFKQPDPLPLRLDWPCFMHDPHGSTKLKDARGRPPSMDTDDLVAHVKESGEHVRPGCVSISVKAAAIQFKVSQSTIRRRAAAAGMEISGGFLHLEASHNYPNNEDNCSDDII